MKRLGILWRRFLRVLLALVSAAIICFCAGSSLSQSVQHPHTPAGSSSTLVNVQELAMPPKAFRAYQKGSELLRKHESQASLVHFQRAIQLAPGLFPAYHNLALAFFELGRLDDALKNFQKAIELSKGSFAPSFFTLAMILYQRGQFAEAQGIVQQGLLADPQSAVGRYSLGLTQYSLGKPPTRSVTPSKPSASIHKSPWPICFWPMFTSACATQMPSLPTWPLILRALPTTLCKPMRLPSWNAPNVTSPALPSTDFLLRATWVTPGACVPVSKLLTSRHSHLQSLSGTICVPRRLLYKSKAALRFTTSGD
jgi:hypothetical protein